MTKSSAGKKRKAKQQNVRGERRALPAILICLAFVPAVGSLVAGSVGNDLPKLPRSQPKAALTFASRLYRHGDEPVRLEASLESEFRFRNDGPEVVRFEQVERSCNCMNPRLTKQELAPGEVGSLIVPIQTINQSPGPHEYTLNLHYSDPAPQMTTLTIKAIFPEKMVVVQPPVLFVSQKSDQPADFQVSISDFRDRPLNVRSLTSTADFVRADISRAAGPKIVQTAFSSKQSTDADATSDETLPNSVTKLNGQVAGGIPAGRHVVLLVAETDDAEFPQVTVPVLINGPEYPEGRAAKAVPSQIQLVASDHPDARRRTTVRVVMPRDWNVSHANTWPEDIAATYKPAEPISETQQVMNVDVELTSLPQQQVSDGIVQLSANDGKDLVTIRVLFHWPTPR